MLCVSARTCPALGVQGDILKELAWFIFARLRRSLLFMAKLFTYLGLGVHLVSSCIFFILNDSYSCGSIYDKLCFSTPLVKGRDRVASLGRQPGSYGDVIFHDILSNCQEVLDSLRFGLSLLGYFCYIGTISLGFEDRIPIAYICF